jgi:hypothetical protein
MGDVSGMKTPTMGSPVVHEITTTPIQDQADGDRSPSATSEKSLMAIASAGIDQLTANSEWIVDSGATAYMAKDRAPILCPTGQPVARWNVVRPPMAASALVLCDSSSKM